MIVEEVAQRMFFRNVEDYAEPALTELAWIDPQIRGFWLAQAKAVLADLAYLTHEDGPMADDAEPARLPSADC